MIDGVPVERFGLERCGAGSLHGVLAFYGESTSIDELDQRLPKADNGGVLTLDLLLEARARGYRARLMEGSLEELRRAIDAAEPAILALQVLNMPGGRRDFFHYVIVDGYDPGEKLVRLHFGDGAVRWASERWLEEPWRGAGNAMVLIEERAGDPVTVAESAFESSVRYAVALEAMGELDAARNLYRRLLDDRPDSALLWTNRGNVERAAGDAAYAETCYRRALELEPDNRDALNNLAWLLLEEGGDVDEAVALAERAVAADGPDPYLALDTLARALGARGDCAGALAEAQRASDLAPEGSGAAAELAESLRRTRERCAAE